MRLLTPFCFFAFFLSGFSALVYELTWTRLLKQIFGSDSFAFAAILIVFIGGIAFGSYIAGNLIRSLFRFDTHKDLELLNKLNLGQSTLLLVFYGVSELILSIYSLLVPILLDTNNFQILWINLANLTLDNNVLAISIKLVLGFFLLLMPTTLIGFGLPVLSELLVMHQNLKDIGDEKVSLIVSNLYATNTFGAILGTVFSGFILLPKIGLHKTILVAVLLNLFVFALSALLIYLNKHFFANNSLLELFNIVINEAKAIRHALKNRSLTIVNEVKQQAGYKRYKFLSWILVIIAFLLGFINLSLELIWTKILALIIGSSTYSLTIVLAVVLLGIALGAYLLNFALKLSHRFQISYLKFLQILLFSFAILLSLSFVFLNNLPWIFISINRIFALPINLLKFIYVSLIYLPVTLIEGMIFAFILFLITLGTDLVDINFLDPVGARVAKVNLFNTLGAIIGAFLVAFVLMPWFSSLGNGIYFSIIFIVFLAYLTASLVFFLEEEPFKASKNKAIVLLIAMLLSLALIQKPMPELFSSGVGVYSGLKFKNNSKKDFNRQINQEILFHKEGLNYVITVVKDKIANAILLKSNGKVEAGIPIDYSKPSKADLSTQILLGAIPMVVKPDAKRSLVIGMGSGLSVEALALSGQVFDLKEIDVCEIEKVIYEAADKFFVKKYPAGIKINRKVLDARNFLLASANNNLKYDIIVSQPSDPWISSNLFTKEFWSLALDNLNDDGIFVQWLQLYSIDPEYLTITLRTFASVFDEVLVFKPINSAELILVGSNTKHKMNIAAAKELIFSQQMRTKLTYIGIETEADFYSTLLLVPSSVRALVVESFQKSSTAPALNKVDTEPKNSNLVKPTLSKANLTTMQDDFSGFKEEKSNLLKVTDDNMLLEFHTYNKLNAFSESIKKNMKFLSKYTSPESLIKYLVDDCDSEFILDLASSHIKANNFENRTTTFEPKEEYFSSPHAKLALGLAEYIHDYSSYPQSFVTLIDIYQKSGQEYKARDLAFDAFFQLERYFSFNLKTHKPVLKSFAPNSINSKRDLIQLYNLAKIFEYNQDFREANNIINTAIDMVKYAPEKGLEQASNRRFVSSLFLEKAKITLAIMRNLQAEEDISLINQIKQDLRTAIDYDALNYWAIIELAKISPRSHAIKLFKNSMKINPNIYEAQFRLAELYIKVLPETQMQFMQAVNSANPDKRITYNLDQALIYLHNALQLQPHSIKANYYMLSLQNLLGNIDHCYRHFNRLERLCGEDFSSCTGELSAEEFKHLSQISVKLNSITRNLQK